MWHLSQDLEDKVAYKDVYMIARRAKLQPREEGEQRKATHLVVNSGPTGRGNRRAGVGVLPLPVSYGSEVFFWGL